MPAMLGNINLFVREIEQSRRFYVETIGLAENEQRSAPPGFMLIEAGNCTITLQDRSAPGADFGAASSIELGFAVDDLALMRSRIQASGNVMSEIQEMGWGSGFDAVDPDGHRLTFYRMRS